MMKDAFNQLTNKLDARVAQMTEESLIEIMENIDDDNNVSFAWGALKKATRDMLMSMMDDDGIREGFEATML